jgi:dihydrofolate reductase
MTVALIWAQAANGVIGADGAVPWQLPEDLASFRAHTIGSTVLMGRATWESLPPRFRPLPERRNLVLTRRADWSAPGASPVSTIDEAVRQAPGDLWVIGGGQVYEAALPYAERLVVTHLEAAYSGDTYAPAIDPGWQVVRREPAEGWSESRTGTRFTITTYERGNRGTPAIP